MCRLLIGLYVTQAPNLPIANDDLVSHCTVSQMSSLNVATGSRIGNNPVDSSDSRPDACSDEPSTLRVCLRRESFTGLHAVHAGKQSSSCSMTSQLPKETPRVDTLLLTIESNKGKGPLHPDPSHGHLTWKRIHDRSKMSSIYWIHTQEYLHDCPRMLSQQNSSSPVPTSNKQKTPC